MKIVNAFQIPIGGKGEEVYEVFSWEFDLHRLAPEIWGWDVSVPLRPFFCITSIYQPC